MVQNNYTIRTSPGKYTSLDKAYRKLIINEINKSDNNFKRWEVYNLIINEIISENNPEIFDNIKFRVTGGENINEVLLDILTYDISQSLIVRDLTEKIRDYINIDWLNNFLK